MRRCLSCKVMNPVQQECCLNCGEALLSRRSATKKSFIQKPYGFPLFLVGAVLVAVFGYYELNNEYGKEVVAERFIAALIDQDADTLKEILVPKDHRIVIDQDSVQALLLLIEKNPSLVQTIEQSLKTKNGEMFTMRVQEKWLGLFPRYSINPKGYIIEVESLGHETVISTEYSEIGYMKSVGEVAEFGPFLAGIYPVRMTTMMDGDGETVDEVIKAKLAGANHTVGLTFPFIEEVVEEYTLVSTELPKQDAVVKNDVMEEPPMETVIIKEVPTAGMYNDYFIIPSSGERYLNASDLKVLSKSDLRLARNEIFARHGYMFKSKELQTYFGSQHWYEPKASSPVKLSAWEKYNVQLIKKHE